MWRLEQCCSMPGFWKAQCYGGSLERYILAGKWEIGKVRRHPYFSLAEQGHCESQYKVASYLKNNIGYGAALEKAEKYFEGAATAKDVTTPYRVDFTNLGFENEEDLQKCRKAADKRDVGALHRLARNYLTEEVIQDYKKFMEELATEALLCQKMAQEELRMLKQAQPVVRSLPSIPVQAPAAAVSRVLPPAPYYKVCSA